MGFLGKLKTYASAILLGSLGLVFAFGAIQTIRLKDQAETLERLRKENLSLKEAVLLTERLREDNAKIKQERDDLLRELNNAEGASVLLSPDVRGIVERMRDGN